MYLESEYLQIIETIFKYSFTLLNNIWKIQKNKKKTSLH